MDLTVPDVNFTDRWGRGGVGGFVGRPAFGHYLGAYRDGMARLPDFETFDVSTSFGTVRAYRFAGPTDDAPVLLLPGRNAATPMYRTNLASLLKHRTVYCVDLLGEAGLSVQHKEIRGAEDQAGWLDEALDGLGLAHAHLIGVSIGGWTAANCAVHRPARVASLTLLDPVMTFTRIPVKAILASIALFAPGVPEKWRRGVLSWISGGSDVDTAEPEAALISAGSKDFVIRTPMPKLFTDDQLRSLDVPALALIAGRSVMLDPDRAAARARELLPRGEIEVWARRDALLESLAPLPAATVTRGRGGLHLLVTLPGGVDDVALADDLRAAGVLVHPLSWHRRLPGPPGLVLGYASHPPDRLREAGAAIVAKL